MTLYEIDNAILDLIDENGEVTDFEALENLAMERDKKLEGIALYIKTLEREAAAIKQEEESLAQRRKAKEKRMENLRGYLEAALDGNDFETARVRISWRKSESLNVADSDFLLVWLHNHGHDDCISYTAPKVNKAEVTRLLKGGVEIPGVFLEENQNMQMK